MIGRALEWLVCGHLAEWFPSRFRLLPNGLRQFKLFALGAEAPRGTPPWYHVSVYLQSFLRPDQPHVGQHIHRWRRMISFVLSGALGEQRGVKYLIHAAPCVYTMGSDVIHRAAWVAPRTWTLFLMFGRNTLKPLHGWGYFDEAYQYRPWDQVRSTETKPL